MAALLARSLAASVAAPLAQLARVAARPRALCALLLGALPRGPPPWGRPPPQLPPARGFKTKGVLRKRCKDCYLVKRRGRWFVHCKSNPRHKQRQM